MYQLPHAVLFYITDPTEICELRICTMGLSHIGLGVSVYTWVICLISTVMPYWSYQNLSRQLIYAGLWRNCTVIHDTTTCAAPTGGWIHAVQVLMVLGTIVLFISLVFGGLYLSDQSRRKSVVVSIASALLGGFLVLSAAIVFSEKNKYHSSTNSVGFCLAIITVVTSFVTSALFFLGRRNSDAGYTPLSP